MGFTDRDGQPTAVPDPPDGGSVYADIGAFQGASYHRNAFAAGTAQEADVLAEVLALRPGDRVLDVGCGNGRHVAEFRDRGVLAYGLDLSPAVLDGAAGLVAGRAQALPFADDSVDAVLSVCQGGFGVSLHDDARAMQEWARVVRTGGRLALSAFSLVFAARYMGTGESLDLSRGLHHHVADVRGGRDGERRAFDLWTAAYSVPHLHLLVESAGFDVLGMAGVEPGAYQTGRRPTIVDPELLIWAKRG